jgi:hypothetical protein
VVDPTGPVTVIPEGGPQGPIRPGDPVWDPDGDPNDSPDAAQRNPKAEACDVPTVTFWPFLFYAHVGCGPPDQSTGEDDYLGQAAQVVDADTARAVSEELWYGRYSQGHSLMRDAVDITPGGPVGAAGAMGVILDAINRAGTWHIPWALEPQLRAQGLVRDVGNVPVGPGGWPISFGPGYGRGVPVPSPWRPNVHATPDPDNPTSYEITGLTTPAEADDYWIVGHAGRAEAAFADVPMLELSGREPRDRFNRTNTDTALVERVGVFRYSPCQVYAARVSLSTCPDSCC